MICSGSEVRWLAMSSFTAGSITRRARGFFSTLGMERLLWVLRNDRGAQEVRRSLSRKSWSVSTPDFLRERTPVVEVR
jgi:hypothetical protein